MVEVKLNYFLKTSLMVSDSEPTPKTMITQQCCHKNFTWLNSLLFNRLTILHFYEVYPG
jgi:hypothetical protein